MTALPAPALRALLCVLLAAGVFAAVPPPDGLRAGLALAALVASLCTKGWTARRPARAATAAAMMLPLAPGLLRDGRRPDGSDLAPCKQASAPSCCWRVTRRSS